MNAEWISLNGTVFMILLLKAPFATDTISSHGSHKQLVIVAFTRAEDKKKILGKGEGNKNATDLM